MPVYKIKMKPIAKQMPVPEKKVEHTMRDHIMEAIHEEKESIRMYEGLLDMHPEVSDHITPIIKDERRHLLVLENILNGTP